MSPQRHFIFWGLTLAVFMLVLWLFSPVLLPFALGLVIAYLLNPAVNALGQFKLGRGPAALFILTLFFAAVGALLLVILPVIYRELLDLSRDIPVYFEKLKIMAAPATARIEAMIGKHDTADVQAIVTDHASSAVAVAGSVAGGLMYGGQMFLHVLALIVITPVVAYYMMKEWVRMNAWGENLLPRPHRETIVGLLQQIDRKLSGFIRGQLTVAFILGVFYALALTIAGLQYGFLIGISAGVLSIIPMVGSAIGFVVGVTIAWLQYGSWEFPAIVAAIFIVGQLVEGNFLTPKIVGDGVGLHPLWIFFALMAGATLLGFLGMVIAVPVAAILSVLIGFAIRQYKFSPYFRGPDQHGEDPNG